MQLDDCTWGAIVGNAAKQRYQSLGIDLEDVKKQLLAVNNLALENKPADMVITSHICRGNYHSTFFTSGPYDSVADYARITVIATGLTDNNLQNTPFGNRASNSVFGNTKKTSQSQPGGMNLNMPSFSLPTMNSTQFGTKAPTSTVQKKDIQIPDFLKNR